MTAAGNASKIKEAKDRMSNAVLGIVLLFSSFLILNTINPDLTSGTFVFTEIEGSTEERDYNDDFSEQSGCVLERYGDSFDSVPITDFIDTIDIRGVGRNEFLEESPEGAYVVDANRLYELEVLFSQDVYTLSTDGCRGAGAVQDYPITRITVESASPIEWVDSSDVYLAPSGLYPGEWRKLGRNVIAGSLIESLGLRHNEIPTVDKLISDSLSIGKDFLSKGGIGAHGGSNPRAIGRIKVAGKFYFPESQHGDEVDLRIQILATDSGGDLILAETPVRLSVTGEVNQAPAVYSRTCAIGIRGEEVCGEPLADEVSIGSRFRVYLQSEDGQERTHDPEDDNISCFLIPSSLNQAKSFTSENAPKSEVCDNPSMGAWVSSSIVPIKPPTHYTVSFYVSDGTLLTTGGSFGIVTKIETDKIYPKDNCTENDGDVREEYASGFSLLLHCGSVKRAGESQFGPWKRGTLFDWGKLTLSSRTCKSVIGPFGVVRFGPLGNPDLPDHTCIHLGSSGLFEDGYRLVPWDL